MPTETPFVIAYFGKCPACHRLYGWWPLDHPVLLPNCPPCFQRLVPITNHGMPTWPLPNFRAAEARTLLDRLAVSSPDTPLEL